MTDETAAEDSEGEAGAEGEDSASSGRVPGKKLVLFIVLPFLIIAAAGGGIYASGLLDSLLGIEEQDEALLSQEEEQGPSVYYEVPEMLVNLNISGRRASYLKISVSLEVGSEEDFLMLDAVLPRIVDNFQVYLRELRIEDLNGSAGLQRLREELLMRVANAAAPTVVRDVLFREMLIQ